MDVWPDRAVIASIAVSVLLVLTASPVFSLDRFMIDTRADWEEWTLNGKPLAEGTGGAVLVTEEGAVRPGSVKREDNACLDAYAFTYEMFGKDHTGGIRSAGSNAHEAGRAIDGDSTTYWAPDPADAPENWWIEVDLGRAVTATKLRLRFAEGKTPFPELKIYASIGDPRFPGTNVRSLNYNFIFSTIKPNTAPIFEYTFAENDEQGRPLSGMFLQFIKIFFPARVQDPGLAEVEVIELGENIALGTLARGGSARTGMVSLPVNLFDGKMWTNWGMSNLGADWLKGVNGPWVNWDLGVRFWVDTIKLTTRPPAAGTGWGTWAPMDGFRLYGSDGTDAFASKPEVWRTPDGREVEWELLADVDNTAIPKVSNFELRFDPPERIQYLFFHHFYGTGQWRTGYALGSRMLEFQIFGRGFSPGVTLRSPLYDLGRSVNLSSIAWQGETPPGTRIQIRTRTGDQVQEIPHWYDVNGRELPYDQWKRLPSSRRGPEIKEQVPDEQHWSGWSPIYETAEGNPFASPSPRRYLLIEANLLSDDPDVAPALDAIVLFHSTPAANELFGEISPNLVTSDPGFPFRFRYTLRPTYGAGNTGFNRILIRTPSKADSVGVEVDGKTITPDVVAKLDSLFIQLPTTVRREQVDVSFRVIPFFNSTLFEAFVFGAAEAWQRVDPDPSKKNATTVMVSKLAQRNELVGNLFIGPRIITPNGDGINDHLSVRFTVFKVHTPRRITVDIYDLSGRLVKRIYDALGVSGNYGAEDDVVWTGENTSGDRALPGLYLCQVIIRGDARDTVLSRIFVVTY